MKNIFSKTAVPNLGKMTMIAIAMFIACTANAQVVDGGTWGDNLKWTLTGSGNNLTLTISGTGAMTDYGSRTYTWNSQKENIKTVVMQDGVTSIGNKAFAGCKNLTSITIPNSVTSIKYSAFYECTSLTSITIPNSVTSIGESAFRYCESLTTITIPNSITSIGDAAFAFCKNLTSINVATDNPYYSSDNGVLFNKNRTTLLRCPEGKSGYIIPNSVTSIGDWAFSRCTSLTSITIPNSVKTIGDNVFYKCERLTSITIPNSVKTIGDDVFYNCERLTSITIPNSVTLTGEYTEELIAKIESKKRAAVEAQKYEELAWKYYRMNEMSEADKQVDLALATRSTADMNFIKARIILNKINWPKNSTYNGEYNTEFRQVVSYCKKAVSDGNCSEIEALYFMRGYANNMLRYYADGRSDFHEVLRLNPHNALANYNIGVSYSNQGNYQMALTYFKAAREIGFSNKDDEKDNFDMIKKCGEKLK